MAWKETIVTTRFFCAMGRPHHFWFRVFGVGLSVRNCNVYPLVFTERNGYVKCFRLGAWVFKVLPRVKDG